MSRFRVLVPLDGSPESESILPLVDELHPSELELFRVFDRSMGPDRRLAAEVALETTAERLRAAGREDVRALHGDGRAADRIVATAVDRGARLVALTTHGRSGFDRLLLGSVAEGVIRSAPIPVLALRTPEPARPTPRPPLLSRVLVPYDGSELAWRAVEALARLAPAACVSLTLLGVVEDALDPAVIAAVEDRPLPEARAIADVEHTTLARLVGEAAARARALGFKAEGAAVTGDVASAILDRADAMDASLIAMSTHGRRGLARFTLGSVTEKVLRASRTPMLIVR